MKISLFRLFIFSIILFNGIIQQSCKANRKTIDPQTYSAIEKNIIVDADTSDWYGITSEVVKEKSHLWIGQGMESNNWLGAHDLSFAWRSVWKENKVYFLFVVNDDKISPFDRPNTWLNDCIEICIDPKLRRGIRKDTIAGETVLNGYEMHFLPMQPPHAFLQDDGSIYFVANPQDTDFKTFWNGEIAVVYTATGYILELAFSIPEVTLNKSAAVGLEIAVCDDDGASRKNLLTWTGIQNDYWIKMDKYGELYFR